MRRALKIAVSLTLLLLLAWTADWSQVAEHLAHIQLPVAWGVLVAYAAQLFVSAWKWQWALIVHGLRLPYGLLARVYWIAFFLNNFLPSSIGGDAYRVYRTMPGDGFRSRALSAVILERVVGLGVLLVLGAWGATSLMAEYAVARVFLALLAGAVACTAALVLALRWSPVSSRLSRLMHRPWFAAIDHNVGLLVRARMSYLPLLGISLLFQAQAIAINYALFAGTGEPVSLAKCALITAVTGLATVIPLSINGIGIVEGAFAGTAILVGVSYEHALVLAILIRLFVLPLSLIAGLLYAFEPAEAQRRAMRT